jgi:hypothetical protein
MVAVSDSRRKSVLSLNFASGKSIMFLDNTTSLIIKGPE